MQIREAREDDWPRIEPFFRVVVAEGRTYAYPEDLTSGQARALWFEQPPGCTLVATGEHGTVLGSAKTGPNRPGRGSGIATASFMVDPAHRGAGVGRALAEHVVAAAREQGYRGMTFNAVVETNTGAVRLWRSLGFEVLATVPAAFDHPEHGPVGLHLMHLRL